MATKRLIDPERYKAILLRFEEHLTDAGKLEAAEAVRSLIKGLKIAPTVDAVEVKHGRWREIILVGGFAEEWGYVCSQCGCTVSDRSKLGFYEFTGSNQRLNYCPNCGADMREVSDA